VPGDLEERLAALAVRGALGKSVEHHRVVRRDEGDVSAGVQVSFGGGAAQARRDSGGQLVAERGHVLLGRAARRGAVDRGGHQEASPGASWLGKGLDTTAQHVSDALPHAERRLQGVIANRSDRPGVVISRRAEQFLLGTEGIVEARRLDSAHRLQQGLERGSLVAPLPEEQHRLVEGFVAVEAGWSAGLVHQPPSRSSGIYVVRTTSIAIVHFIA
jgi:hypothetical protein